MYQKLFLKIQLIRVYIYLTWFPTNLSSDNADTQKNVIGFLINVTSALIYKYATCL